MAPAASAPEAAMLPYLKAMGFLAEKIRPEDSRETYAAMLARVHDIDQKYVKDFDQLVLEPLRGLSSKAGISPLAAAVKSIAEETGANIQIGTVNPSLEATPAIELAVPGVTLAEKASASVNALAGLLKRGDIIDIKVKTIAGAEKELDEIRSDYLNRTNITSPQRFRELSGKIARKLAAQAKAEVNPAETVVVLPWRAAMSLATGFKENGFNKNIHKKVYT